MDENSVDPTRKIDPPDPEEDAASITVPTLASTTNSGPTEFSLDKINSEDSSTSSEDEEEHVLEEGFHQLQRFIYEMSSPAFRS